MAAEKCTATAKSTGNRCTRPVVPGATVCRFHGGAATQVRVAGHLRLAEAEAQKILARMDVQAVDDPLGELAKLAGQVLAWRDVCADMVNELKSVRYGTENGEQLRAEVALFERALDRCASVLVAIAKLNIDDRLARISEQQAEVVVRAVDAALAAAGLTGEKAAEARRVAARELRGAA